MDKLSVFIRTDKTFEQFVDEFSMYFCIDLTIQKDDDGGMFCKYYCLDIESLLFSDYDLEDDLGIVFSKYNYQLSLYKINRGGFSEEYNDLYYSVAKYYARKIATDINAQCMVVRNCQTILLET